MQVRCKDARILIYGAVLDDHLVAVSDVHHVLEPLVEEINLQIERPSFHILVKISQIWVKIYRLELRRPTVVRRQHLGKRSLAASYVSCNRYMHILVVWFSYLSNSP